MRLRARYSICSLPAEISLTRKTSRLADGKASTHRDRPYQAGRSKHWVKVKNCQHPAKERVIDALR
jgi:hypothetical protein